MTTAHDIIGCEVVTESGDLLGHCWELRAEATDSGYVVTDLLTGRRGLIERLGLRRALAARDEDDPRHVGVQAISWSDVVRLEPGVVVVGDDAELSSHE